MLFKPLLDIEHSSKQILTGQIQPQISEVRLSSGPRQTLKTSCGVSGGSLLPVLPLDEETTWPAIIIFQQGADV